MIVSMVDERAVRFQQMMQQVMPPVPTPQPVEPTAGPLDALVGNYLRTSGQLAEDQVKYGGQVGGLGSRTVDLLTSQGGVSDSPGLRAGALAGDILLDPNWLIPAVGAVNAGVNVGRTAMGTTARTLANNPRMSPGVQNVLELINARHASPNPNLGATLSNPRNVPVVSGRDFGPGFYYEARRPLDSVVPYTDLLARYGDNFYMPQMSPMDMLRISRSRGGADLRQDLGLEGVNRISGMNIDDPIFRRAMEEGFTGAKGTTSWLVGNPDRVGGLPNLGVRPVTPADDATYPALEAMLRRLFPQ
jgi:hypothetical protein